MAPCSTQPVVEMGRRSKRLPYQSRPGEEETCVEQNSPQHDNGTPVECGAGGVEGAQRAAWRGEREGTRAVEKVRQQASLRELREPLFHARRERESQRRA